MYVFTVCKQVSDLVCVLQWALPPYLILLPLFVLRCLISLANLETHNQGSTYCS